MERPISGGHRVRVRVIHTEKESRIVKTICRVLGLG